MKIKSKKNTGITILGQVENRIIEVRKQRVMIDADLAVMYGVTTKRLNEQVKRNIDRFPEDFMFKLTQEEVSEVVAICDHLSSLKFSYQLPYVFTEHGALMLASVLNSDVAIRASVEIVRAFVRMRSILIVNKDLVKKINALESKLTDHDQKFKAVFDAIKQLMLPCDNKPKRPVGFRIDTASEDHLLKVKARAKTVKKRGGRTLANPKSS